jgi:hypothetical protein
MKSLNNNVKTWITYGLFMTITLINCFDKNGALLNLLLFLYPLYFLCFCYLELTGDFKLLRNGVQFDIGRSGEFLPLSMILWYTFWSFSYFNRHVPFGRMVPILLVFEWTLFSVISLSMLLRIFFRKEDAARQDT